MRIFSEAEAMPTRRKHAVKIFRILSPLERLTRAVFAILKEREPVGLPTSPLRRGRQIVSGLECNTTTFWQITLTDLPNSTARCIPLARNIASARRARTRAEWCLAAGVAPSSVGRRTSAVEMTADGELRGVIHAIARCIDGDTTSWCRVFLADGRGASSTVSRRQQKSTPTYFAVCPKHKTEYPKPA